MSRADFYAPRAAGQNLATSSEPLSREEREREGPDAKRWEGEGARQGNRACPLTSSHGVMARDDAPRRAGLLHISGDVDVELADLFAQRVAVEAEELRRLELIPARRSQRNQDQRLLDFAQHAIIKAGGGQPALMRREVIAQMTLCGTAQPFIGGGLGRRGRRGRLGELGL